MNEPRTPKIHTARAELVLALDSALPLRAVPLKPDPLQPFAAAVADVRADLGESADVAIDLLPLTPARARHYRRRAAAQGGSAPRPGPAALLSGTLEQAMAASRGLGAVQPRTARPTPAPRARSTAAPAVKYAEGETLFAAQILIRAQSEIPGRAQAHVKRLLAAFAGLDGANYLKAAGVRLGPIHLGADFVLFRRGFDRRMDSGLFAPRRESVVTASEIAGLLKPPTRWCELRNVARSGGLVPPAPRQLPTYTLGARDLLPLGYVPTPEGTERLAAARLADTLFELILGKAGYGKTELALVQFIALAHGGHGGWFLDPHRDAAVRARPYLAHRHLAAKIWDIDLTVRSPDAMMAGWNPLSMEGRAPEDLQDVVAAITAGFASALNWTETSNRALTILTKACEALAELSFLLCRRGRPDLSPTIFQIRSLLTDEQWREQVVRSLSAETRRFWTRTFPNYPTDAIPVVTNAIDRIATSQSAKAFFGSSRSTYDVRTAMDQGKLVWVCPAGTGPTDKLVSCLLIFDLFRAGLSRRDLPPEARRPFHAFIDELTAVDGAAKGNLAAIVEQLRKFAVKLFAATQMASRLSPTTRDSLMQNQSILSSSASEADAARLVARQWGSQVDPETVSALPRYHHIVSVTDHGESTGPFKIRGAEVTALFEPWFNPGDLPRLEASIDRNLARRPMREILADQARLDDWIADYLAGDQIRHGGGSAPAPQARDGARGRASGQTGTALDAAPLASVTPIRPDGGSTGPGRAESDLPGTSRSELE